MHASKHFGGQIIGGLAGIGLQYFVQIGIVNHQSFVPYSSVRPSCYMVCYPAVMAT